MRKIVQVAFEPESIDGEVSSDMWALCDDGTVWLLKHKGKDYEWIRNHLIPPIPQDSPIQDSSAWRG